MSGHESLHYEPTAANQATMQLAGLLERRAANKGISEYVAQGLQELSDLIKEKLPAILLKLYSDPANEDFLIVSRFANHQARFRETNDPINSMRYDLSQDIENILFRTKFVLGGVKYGWNDFLKINPPESGDVMIKIIVKLPDDIARRLQPSPIPEEPERQRHLQPAARTGDAGATQEAAEVSAEPTQSKEYRGDDALIFSLMSGKQVSYDVFTLGIQAILRNTRGSEAAPQLGENHILKLIGYAKQLPEFNNQDQAMPLDVFHSLQAESSSGGSHVDKVDTLFANRRRSVSEIINILISAGAQGSIRNILSAYEHRSESIGVEKQLIQLKELDKIYRHTLDLDTLKESMGKIGTLAIGSGVENGEQTKYTVFGMLNALTDLENAWQDIRKASFFGLGRLPESFDGIVEQVGEYYKKKNEKRKKNEPEISNPLNMISSAWGLRARAIQSLELAAQRTMTLTSADLGKDFRVVETNIQSSGGKRF